MHAVEDPIVDFAAGTSIGYTSAVAPATSKIWGTRLAFTDFSNRRQWTLSHKTSIRTFGEFFCGSTLYESITNSGRRPTNALLWSPELWQITSINSREIPTGRCDLGFSEAALD
jgi:hypothetical protein